MRTSMILLIILDISDSGFPSMLMIIIAYIAIILDDCSVNVDVRVFF